MGLSRLSWKDRDIDKSCQILKTVTVLQSCQTLTVNCVVTNHVHFVAGLPQKNSISPFIVKQKKLKYVKGVSCVDQEYSIQNVTNVHIVAQNLPVGARLNQVWKTWATLGPSPKDKRVLKGRLHSPLLEKPNLDQVSHDNKWLCQPYQ